MSRAFDTVLFDLDGTLLDSIGLIVDSFHHTMQAHGLPPQPDEHWRRGIGTPLAKALAPWARDDAERDALVATYRAYNLAHHDARVRAYPGVVEAVRTLAGAGVALAVVTSKNQASARRGLGVIGVADAFPVVMGADDVERHKPHREPVDRALERLGRPSTACMFVGDSLHDVGSAHAAGVVAAAVTWGAFGRDDLAAGAPHHVVDTPAELVALALG